MRSGSATARCSSRPVAPAVQRQAHPAVGVGRRRRRRHDAARDGTARRSGEKRRKSDGTNSTLAPESRQEPLGRPEEAGEEAHAGLGEQRVEVDQQRAEHLELLEVVALAERVQERPGWPGPSGTPMPVTRADRGDGVGDGASAASASGAVEDLVDVRDGAEVAFTGPHRERSSRGSAPRAPRRGAAAPSCRRRRGRATKRRGDSSRRRSPTAGRSPVSATNRPSPLRKACVNNAMTSSGGPRVRTTARSLSFSWASSTHRDLGLTRTTVRSSRAGIRATAGWVVARWSI